MENNTLIQSRDRFSAEHPEERLQIRGREWGFIRTETKGPALVLLPGTLGRADVFWQQIDALKDKARILALSYPASGSLQDWCGDIKDLMKHHQMDSATVLGSSLGGYAAMYFTAQNGVKVDNLIAANTLSSAAITQKKPPYNTDIDALPRAALLQGFQQSFAAWATEQPHRQSLIDLLLQEVTGRIPEPELRARLNVLKYAPELPPISLPNSRIFTVESTDDRLIPPVIQKAVRALLKPAESFVFENGSHFPYITQPEKYTALIAKVMGL